MRLPLYYDTVDVYPAVATAYDADGNVVASGVSEGIAQRIIAHDGLVAALEAMCVEFRAADLPYGSRAYLMAQEALLGFRSTGTPA